MNLFERLAVRFLNRRGFVAFRPGRSALYVKGCQVEVVRGGPLDQVILDAGAVIGADDGDARWRAAPARCEILPECAR